MKTFNAKKLASSASLLYQVTISDGDLPLIFQVAINDEKDLDNIVHSAYQSIKKPALPKQPTYKEQRKSEYPPMEDYLDGIVKNDQQQIRQYIDACNAVKAKYPKE